MTDAVELLLVEDNPGDARLIEEMLVEADGTPTVDAETVWKANLIHVTDLETAIETVDDQTVDLVLLDLDLPDANGMETLERMLDPIDVTPVIVLTGRPEEELGIEAVRHGAQDYLVKGDVRADAFVRAIQYAIERTKTQQELQQRTQELAILNQLMRHDVKNDISLVVGRGHELTEYVDPRGEELLAEVLTAANHVLQLTQTVGETVEAVTGDGADLHAVDPVDIAERQIKKARRLYGENAVTLEEIPEDVRVEADELLSAVVRNLLGNALLYTSDDPDVRVSMNATKETVTLHIADNGPGIPDGQKELIFGEGESGVESQGTGIGLYLVDQLIQQYDGRVWVEDNDPTGAVFHVELRRV